jgi:hypothetical protein
MADGRLDAPCRRMKRLEFWRVFIDAEHMASELLTSGLHDAFVSYRFFPTWKLVGHIRHQFRSGRLVDPCRNRDFATRGCFLFFIQPNNRPPQTPLAQLIRVIGGAKAGMRSRLRPNCQHDQAARTESRNLATSSLRRLESPESDCAAASTCEDADPVSLAPRCTSPILEDTCWVPVAAC